MLALGAVALWSTLAVLATGLSTVPPLLLLGLALCGAALAAAPTWRQWRVPPLILLLGVYGLFGFHLLLFLALRQAPPVQANLINYLWPLLIVLLAPVFGRGRRLAPGHVAAALLGAAGAALVITNGHLSLSSAHWRGYALALGSAFTWATYSLLTQRARAFPTAAVGLFCLVSGLLALLAHALLEPRYFPTLAQSGLIAALALGPMGLAFFLWDAALKRGDARTLGALAYLTPLGSTILLIAAGHGQLTWVVVLATGMIVGGAVLGSVVSARRRDPGLGAR